MFFVRFVILLMSFVQSIKWLPENSLDVYMVEFFYFYFETLCISMLCCSFVRDSVTLICFPVFNFAWSGNFMHPTVELCGIWSPDSPNYGSLELCSA